MSVEFDPTSRDEQPEDNLPSPASHKRRWVIAACTGAAVVVLGGGAVALAQTSASAGAPTGYASSGYAGHGAGPGRPGGTGEGGTGTQTPKPRTPHLDGTVKSVSGTKILIADMDGFTRTIITSAKTTYKDSLTASPAVGTRVAAEGTVDADGTSLDATTVSTAPTGPGGPGGFGGHGGPGGPGGPGGGTRPTGAPTDRPSGAPTGKPTGTSTSAPSAAPTS